MADPQALAAALMRDDDQAAMMPETFANPAVRQMLARALTFPQGQTAGNEDVRYRTASPLVNISDQDIDRAINVGMGAGPGIIAGRLAKTADLAALARAEELHAAGAPRDAIHAKTGWYKGADDKWRFEIDDSKSAISPRVADEFQNRHVGDQVPVQNADRFMEHPELFSAYPDLWRVNTRLEKGGGYPFQPSGHYSVRESGAENIGLNADTLGRARSLNMHELQHAVQQREGFAPGADAKAVGLDEYYKTPGEIEAYNVQRRLFMTPQERAAKPPWTTE